MKENLNVVEIMRDIEKKALKRRKINEENRLKQIDIRKLKGIDILNIENDLSLNATKSNQDHLICSKLSLRKISNTGILSKAINYGLRKFYFALRYLLDGLFVSQEKFNIRVNDFMERNSDNLNFDYTKFEERFRGDKNELKTRFSKYLRFFEGKESVLDIACGRGDFLELLKENNIDGVGIDIEPKFIEDLEKKGFKVFEKDALDFLENSVENFDGAFSSQFAEHLNSQYLFSLIKNVHNKISEGSFFIMETINVKSLSVFSNSVFKDPSHKQMIHPELLKFFFEEAGFKEVSFIFSSEFKENEKLCFLNESNENDKIYNENIRKLNELLFAPQDYAVVGKK